MDTCQCLLKLILLLVSFLDPTYQRFWYAWCWKSLWPGGVGLLYLFCTLGRFGFGPNFILLVKTLYPPQWQWFAPNKIRSALFPRNSISVYQIFVKFVQFMSVESCFYKMLGNLLWKKLFCWACMLFGNIRGCRNIQRNVYFLYMFVAFRTKDWHHSSSLKHDLWQDLHRVPFTY